MRVSALDSNDDWTMGKGRANYITGSEAIAQNVKTRLRSFEDDWYLDVTHGVPWIELFSNLGTQRRIVRAVERTVLQTEGVLSMSDIQVTNIDKNRRARIEFDYTDIFSRTASESLELVL